MPGNSFGHMFRITTAGESHGPGNVVIIDGVPAGLELGVEDLQPDLDRRRPGQSKIVTQRKEADEAEIMSGVFEGRTTGTSLAIVIRNTDQRSRDYGDIKDKYRPGHADYTFDAKYGFRDYRGGGRSSARETNVRVAAGAVAKKMLLTMFGTRIVGYVDQVGDIKANIEKPEAVTLEEVEATPVRCPDRAAAARMIELIERVRSERDSIGGSAVVVASGVPAGLGEPVFDKLKADLGRAMFSLPAVVGVEYGVGFGVVTARGSENNDAFVAERGRGAEGPSGRGGERDAGTEGQRDQGAEAAERQVGVDSSLPSTPWPLGPSAPLLHTATNRHGGMLGGISTGMPIVLRCAVKPTSSIPQEKPTVTSTGEATTISTKGRHDPCLLPRFVPMAEAMVAIVLADHALRQRGQRGWGG